MARKLAHKVAHPLLTVRAMHRPEPLISLQELARLIATDLEQRMPDGEKRYNYRLAVASALTLADQLEQLSREDVSPSSSAS